MINILIACEESQIECIAFRNLGFNAFSCDIQDQSGGYPEFHIKTDVLSIINGKTKDINYFITQDKKEHNLPDYWDLVIAHPPCTYLTKASSVRLFPNKIIDPIRYEKLLAARDFFLNIYYCNSKRLCIENPTPLKIASLPDHQQVIQPYMFGDAYQKRTLLWLKNLPILFSTDLICDYVSYVNGGNHSGSHGIYSSQKMRSKSFPGIAAAMANQWGKLL